MKMIQRAFSPISLIASLLLLASCEGKSVKSAPKKAAEPLPPPLPQEKILLSPEAIQLYGLESIQATERALTKTVTLPVNLVRDETRITEIQTQFPGKIEEIYVGKIGSLIQKNQPLFKMSSPEATSLQESFIDLLRKAANPAEDQEAYAAQANAIRERLTEWGFTPQDIDRIIDTQIPFTDFTFYSLSEGLLKTHRAIIGMHVEPKTVLFTVADLSHALAEGELPIEQAPYLHSGQQVQLRLRQFPSIWFMGHINAIKQDEALQRIKVEFSFTRLPQTPKIDQKGIVTLTLSLGTYLAVPKEAVVESHKRKIVYIPLSGGRFESREIQTGLAGDDAIQVTGGLNAGDFVVLNPKRLFHK